MLSSRSIWDFGSNSVMENPIIEEIVKNHGKTVAQVLQRWGLEEAVSVLPKSYNKRKIIENYHFYEWSLIGEDHEKIGNLQQKNIVRREGFISSATSPYSTIQDLRDGEI